MVLDEETRRKIENNRLEALKKFEERKKRIEQEQEQEQKSKNSNCILNNSAVSSLVPTIKRAAEEIEINSVNTITRKLSDIE
jgi:hypothetical protein